MTFILLYKHIIKRYKKKSKFKEFLNLGGIILFCENIQKKEECNIKWNNRNKNEQNDVPMTTRIPM